MPDASKLRHRSPDSRFAHPALPTFFRLLTERSSLPEAIACSQNLLPPQYEAFIEAQGQLPNLLKVAQANGSILSLGIPAALSDNNSHYDDRYFWFPKGIPTGHRIALASSRLGNKLFQMPIVFEAIRTLLTGSDRELAVVIGSRTTLAKPTQRACQLFDHSAIMIQPMPAQIDQRWVQATFREPCKTFPIYFSKAADAAHRSSRRETQQVVDSLNFDLADEIRAMYIHPDGNIRRLVSDRLERRPATTYVLMDKSIADKVTKEALVSQGAIAWWFRRASEDRKSSSSKLAATPKGHTRTSLEIETESYLSHWTRGLRRSSVQRSLSIWDRYFFSVGDTDSGPLGSLCCILAEQRLTAASDLVKGSRSVVCFTEVPLQEFPQRRRFRSHLARWDFENFGVAIRKSVLQSMGARAVNYGPESDCADMNERDRIFFQPCNASQPNSIDWSREREWRHIGDVDLRQIAPSEAIVFVPDAKCAEVIRPLSRWPVVILSDLTNPPG